MHYKGEAVAAEDERRRATAMINDAFQMFHFGPSFVIHRAKSMNWLAAFAIFSARARAGKILAHEWQVTGVDLDRGWSDAEVTGSDLGGRAPARPMPVR